MDHLLAFLKIKAVEAAGLFVIFVILAAMYKESYWLNRPDSAATVVAGALAGVLLFFVWWGYLFTSGAAFAASGAFGSWRPIWLGIAGAITFAGHSAFVLKSLYFKVDPIVVGVWLLFISLNLSLPFAFVRSGVR